MGSDLIITDLQVGTGAEAVKGALISVHYVGTFKEGSKFDSSIDRGRPLEFVLGSGRVIKGWDQGILGMRVGGKRRLFIPAHLAYGDRAVGPIPPQSDLVFEVELFSVLTRDE